SSSRKNTSFFTSYSHFHAWSWCRCIIIVMDRFFDCIHMFFINFCQKEIKLIYINNLFTLFDMSSVDRLFFYVYLTILIIILTNILVKMTSMLYSICRGDEM